MYSIPHSSDCLRDKEGNDKSWRRATRNKTTACSFLGISSYESPQVAIRSSIHDVLKVRLLFFQSKTQLICRGGASRTDQPGRSQIPLAYRLIMKMNASVCILRIFSQLRITSTCDAWATMPKGQGFPYGISSQYITENLDLLLKWNEVEA